MKLKSTHFAALILPNGQVAPANREIIVTDVDWNRMVENPKVQSWVAGRYLIAESETANDHRADPPKGGRKQGPAGSAASTAGKAEG
jgi:hypothetical protein